MSKEIWVVPFFGQGHLLPSIELCKQIASRNFKTILVIPSNLSSSVPAAVRHYPLFGVVEIQSGQEDDPGRGPLPPPGGQHHQDLAMGLENILKAQLSAPNADRPVCAVLDVMMDWTAEIFRKFEVPTVGFFTSGACSAAIEHATWKAQPLCMGPNEILLIPGLPDEMALTYLDIKQQQHGPPGPGPGPGPGPFGGPGPRGMGPPPPNHGLGRPGPVEGTGPPGMGPPPKPGGRPPWLEAIEGSEGVMINTCDELERPFLQYLGNQTKKPVWGVGPLLPEQYWKSAGSVIHDHEIRTNRRSSVTEEEVIQWLESKPRGSVLYVSFGSEVGPTLEEHAQLAEALEESNSPFIWVIQPRAGRSGPPGPNPAQEENAYFPHGLDSQVGPRGLIIQGWAPQLLILSHPSTGGFLSHCGWNSTAEALGRGVPLLVWPIRGDQYHNAKLVVAHLQVGLMVCDDFSNKVKKEDIVEGIESLMSAYEIKHRAEGLAATFGNGFPLSSVAALDAFTDFINHK